MRAPVFPLFEPEQILSASSLRAEQHERLRRLWRHNRFLHGSGVVCGLWVVPAGDPGRPWAVRICPGVAIGCCGEEISVPESTVLDIHDSVWKLPPEQEPRTAYIGLRYRNQAQSPTEVPPQGCCSGLDNEQQPSRLADGFEFTTVWQGPSREPRPFDPCEPGSPPCPGDPCEFVILARVDLPGEGVMIAIEQISLL